MFEVAAIITSITPQPYPARSTNLLNYFGQFLSSIPIPCDSTILLLGMQPTEILVLNPYAEACKQILIEALFIPALN